MLTIRPEQMATLAAASDHLFEQRLIAHLRDRFPQRYAEISHASADDTDFLNWVRGRLEQATGYGFEQEGDYAAFVVLIVAVQQLRADLGPADNNFMNWTHPVFQLADTPGYAKMAYIEHQLEQQAADDLKSARLATELTAVRDRFG